MLKLTKVPPFRLYVTKNSLTWETNHRNRYLDKLIAKARSIRGWDRAEIYDREGKKVWDSESVNSSSSTTPNN